MSCLQLTVGRPTLNVSNISRSRFLNHNLRSSLRLASQVPGVSPGLTANLSVHQRRPPVCQLGGTGKSEGDEASPWKSLEKAMGSLKKEPSLEDVLRKQIEKQEYFDDGGSGGSPPLGGGDGSGGSEDKDSAGFMDEFIQVILATIGFIFLYIYIIDGEDLTRLAKDYIKYLFGGKKSVRLRRAMEEWERSYKKFTKEEVVREGWLEQAIVNTPTWWDSPAKYRRLQRSRMESRDDY